MEWQPVPLGLTLVLWLAEVREPIAFAEKERTGLAYTAAVQRLLEPLLLRDEAAVASAVARIDGLDTRYEQELATHDAWRARAPPRSTSSLRSKRAAAPCWRCSRTPATLEPDPRTPSSTATT